MEFSIVIPIYNEAEIIEKNVRNLKTFLEKISKSYEIILEQDGSTDKTPEILEKLSHDDSHIVYLSYPLKMGKGWGLRKAFAKARGDLIIMMDMDFSIDPEIIYKFLKLKQDADIIIAERYVKKNEMPFFRFFFSRIYNIITRFLFGLNINDTQSGFKAIKNKVLKNIELKSNGFEIDVELLSKAHKKKFIIKEIPVNYIYREKTKFSLLKHGIKTLLNTFKIWFEGFID
jgi:glycosyltransferase involved in cell wall biosynthesis